MNYSPAYAATVTASLVNMMGGATATTRFVIDTSRNGQGPWTLAIGASTKAFTSHVLEASDAPLRLWLPRDDDTIAQPGLRINRGAKEMDFPNSAC